MMVELKEGLFNFQISMGDSDVPAVENIKGYFRGNGRSSIKFGWFGCSIWVFDLGFRFGCSI